MRYLLSVLFFATALFSAEPRTVGEAEMQFNREYNEAKAVFDKTVKVAQDKFVAFLKEEMKRLTEKGDLDGAIAVRDKIKGLERDPVSVPKKERDRAANKTTNLMSLLDLSKDVIAGNWKMTANGLVSDLIRNARIQFSYTPPEEYDLRASFQRVRGDGAITFILSVSGRNFGYVLAGWDNTISGFELIDGKWASDNSTRTNKGIDTGKRYSITFEVRKNSVRAILDGKVLTELKTDYANLSIDKGWSLREQGLIGVGSFESSFVIQSFEIIGQ